jgi:biotin-dependent carboxylase-like uncharacterized protein
MIKVLKPGLWTSIQDLGRPEWRHLGVPVSGSMDQHSAKQANLILGNHAVCPVMEVTLMGPKLSFESATKIAISGGDLCAKLNDMYFELNTIVSINSGDVLSFSGPADGARAYISVLGGFDVPEIMGSRSWYKNVTPQYKLEGGEKLSFKKDMELVDACHDLNIFDFNSNILEVHKAPEFDHLSDSQQSLLLQKFTIGVNDRMGYRLNEEIDNNFESMISSAVLPGTVQLTPSGKLIILMRDCQTTGGYPRILQLSEDAINVLAQKGMGEEIKFELQE